jgi:Rieske Fe-S protein
VLVHMQNGKFVAYSAVCTHQGCTVAYQNGELALPLPRLGLRSVQKGSGSQRPRPGPLPQIPIRVQNGESIGPRATCRV